MANIKNAKEASALPTIIFGRKMLKEVNEFKLINSTKGTKLVLTSNVSQSTGPEIDPVLGKVEVTIKSAQKETKITGTLYQTELHGDNQAMYQILTIEVE